jgi:hypothetical protein
MPANANYNNHDRVVWIMIIMLSVPNCLLCGFMEFCRELLLQKT